MSFFSSLKDIVDIVSKGAEIKDDIADTINKGKQAIGKETEDKEAKSKIALSSVTHHLQWTNIGEDDSEYRIEYNVDSAFKEYDTHAAEATMSCLYSPDKDPYTISDSELAMSPYIAVFSDDCVYCRTDEYKKTGSIKDAMEFATVNDSRFLFKAKVQNGNEVIYFYGFDSCDGYWANQGLGIAYHKSFLGTEDEKKLMRVLDDVAASYSEVRL